MKKSFKLHKLGCANCAAKMQQALSKIEGVSEVSVNFMAQKLTFDYLDEARLESILREAGAVIRRIEPDCSIII